MALVVDPNGCWQLACWVQQFKSWLRLEPKIGACAVQINKTPEDNETLRKTQLTSETSEITNGVSIETLAEI